MRVTYSRARNKTVAGRCATTVAVVRAFRSDRHLTEHVAGLEPAERNARAIRRAPRDIELARQHDEQAAAFFAFIDHDRAGRDVVTREPAQQIALLHAD